MPVLDPACLPTRTASPSTPLCQPQALSPRPPDAHPGCSPPLHLPAHPQVLSLDFTSNRLSGTAFPQDWLVPGAMPALGDVLLGRNPRLSGTLPARLPWHNLHTL